MNTTLAPATYPIPGIPELRRCAPNTEFDVASVRPGSLSEQNVPPTTRLTAATRALRPFPTMVPGFPIPRADLSRAARSF